MKKICKLGVASLKKVVFYALPAAVFAILGRYLRGMQSTSFLGLISWCLAGLVVCVGLLVWLYGHRPRSAQILGGILSGVLTIGLVMVTVVGILVADASVETTALPCDYMIVLGAKVNGTAPSSTLQERIDGAYDYLLAHPETVAVLSGGQGSDEGISEAQCMYNVLTERGIAPERLWLEERATSTWENLRFSLAIIEEKTGSIPKTVGIVSSGYHMYRAGLFAEKCGTEAVAIPTETENKLHFINYYLREIAGVWHYIILGGLYHD